jgi:hypothetical protein
MLGWMLIFVFIVLSATFFAFSGGIGATFGMTSTIVFGILLLLSAFTHLLRGRA